MSEIRAQLIALAAKWERGKYGDRGLRLQAEESARLLRAAAEALDTRPASREAPPHASNGWQAIETAPKDGTPIIAISQIGNIYKMVYENEGWFSKNTGRWLLPEEVAGWMPLPLVPERRTPADDPERT